jgi:hypothetical protein
MPVSPALSGSSRRDVPVQSEASLRLGGFEFLNLHKCRLRADTGISSARRMILIAPVFIGVFGHLKTKSEPKVSWHPDCKEANCCVEN